MPLFADKYYIVSKPEPALDRPEAPLYSALPPETLIANACNAVGTPEEKEILAKTQETLFYTPLLGVLQIKVIEARANLVLDSSGGVQKETGKSFAPFAMLAMAMQEYADFWKCPDRDIDIGYVHEVGDKVLLAAQTLPGDEPLYLFDYAINQFPRSFEQTINTAADKIVQRPTQNKFDTHDKVVQKIMKEVLGAAPTLPNSGARIAARVFTQ